uniref:Uncharacterized protein n=1 Tax=Spermophilus dauricus TaxID=99837 RepID=A0A8C9PIL5_SPEDA
LYFIIRPFYSFTTKTKFHLRQTSTVFFPFRDVASLDIYSGKYFPKASYLSEL